MKANQIVDQYVNKIGMRQVYYGWYPFHSYENVLNTYSRIPNTLPTYQGNGILAQSCDPNDYDAWLQGNLDTAFNWFEGGPPSGSSPAVEPCPQQDQYAGGFRWSWQLCNEISKLADIPIIGDQQIHQWLVHCSEIDREPTNEELDLTAANLPVSYGAKGSELVC